MKKVSVIIPVHNSSKYLSECINSVVNQTYKNIEIIVVDDNSNDSSLSIINSYKDKRIKVIKLKKNMGVSIARNKGVIKASGDYICFIDSDDYWYKDKLEKQVKFMENNNYIFTYGSYGYLRNNVVVHRAKVPRKITYKEALKNTTIFTSTVMFDMSKLKKEDLYMPDIRLGQDTSCWWKILRKGITAYGMDEMLVVYRVGNKSLSSNKIRSIKGTWNIYKLEDISFIKRLWYFMWYLFNAIKRRII